MLPIANERGNVPDMPGKRDPLDFVLWQPSAADEPAWPSPWGAGRPGWHIECSAMSMTYLGERFEIHGGGGDLVFPHHESERAQSEGATGDRPFVGWWTHAGMLSYQGDKMSKSLGNLVLVRDLLHSYSGDAIRHYLVGQHYRSEVDFVEDDLKRSADAVEILRRASLRAEEMTLDASAMAQGDELSARVREHCTKFLAAMDADLDTPSAMSELASLAELALATDAGVHRIIRQQPRRSRDIYRHRSLREGIERVHPAVASARHRLDEARAGIAARQRLAQRTGGDGEVVVVHREPRPERAADRRLVHQTRRVRQQQRQQVEGFVP
jgi:L-cysteine:1D-myo-inositol 2-amino-2-deoxy-alpha-D-glucopyranoside ligase